MRRNLLAVGAAALALGSAQATEYDFTFASAADYTDSNPISDGSLCPIDIYGNSRCTLPFFGHLDVVVASDADGTYTGAAIEEVDFRSNLEGFIYHYGDVPQLFELKSGSVLVGMSLYPSITVVDGRVTDFSAVYSYAYGTFGSSGLGFSEDNGCQYCHWFASGALTPIPEPAPALLLLSGLALLPRRPSRA